MSSLHRFFSQVSLALFHFFILHNAYAVMVTDYPSSSYEVLFTNPLCKEYFYPTPLRSMTGDVLKAKPKNVYCKKSDFVTSASRPTSPNYRILEWINDPQTEEIFLTYFSFSNSSIKEALCRGIQERNLKVTFILDSKTDRTLIDKLGECQPPQPTPDDSFTPNHPQFLFRGNSGRFGSAHNKLLIVNPHSPKLVKIAFGSGNLSSGTALHHDNWSFVTVPSKSYFAQIHLCLKEGMINHGKEKKDYVAYIAECRNQIPYPEEDDIKVFLIPGEGAKLSLQLRNHLQKADEIQVTAHRFSLKMLISGLERRLQETGMRDKIRLVVDDDLYWSGVSGQDFGNNSLLEYNHVNNLMNSGLSVKFMETNFKDNLLHHNKFIVFKYSDHTNLTDSSEDSALFTGAGNFTGQAFSDNYENYYLVTNPSIVDQYDQQFHHLWSDLASSVDQMPVENIFP